MTRKPPRIPAPANEAARLAALHRYQVLDTPPEAAFDRITRLAARIFHKPTALISLVDESRAWFKSAIGFDGSEVPRDTALCSFALLTDALLIVPDAREDNRFACNPLVQSEPGVRFYAGAPLITHDGFNLGTLCLLDSQPCEPLTAEQQATLVDLATIVVDELALKLAIYQSVQSEEKYRSLFESIDEGFCICEMLFDEDGQAHDYRFLEVNPVFEDQTGLRQATGKTARELMPDLEAFWFEVYVTVVQTGKPTRFEQQSLDTNRWFDVNAFRVGEMQNHRFAVLFTDITERKQREAQLQRAAAMDAFRVKLSDTLRSLSDPIEIQSAAMGVLGEHLAVDRATYAEITPDGETAIINDNYVRSGVAKLTGNIPIAAYGSILDQMRTGQTMVYSNIETEAGLTEAERAQHTAVGSVANISVPLVKGGRWIAALGVHYGKPRHWTGEEIALVQETAERTWAAVERARAEAALQASHETFRYLVENSPFGVYVVDADFRLAQVSAGAQKVFATIQPLIGRDFTEVLRLVWSEPFAGEAIARFRHTLETGEPYSAPNTTEQRNGTAEIESYDWRIERIALPDGRLGVVCHFYDLSERQRYEAALRESEERFRNLGEALPLIVSQSTPDGQIEYVNPYWTTFSGHTPEDFADGDWLAAVHPDDRQTMLEQWQSALTEGRSYEYEFRARSADGSYHWLLARGVPVHGADGKIARWINTAVDIHDRKQAEANLRASEARYRLLTEAIPQLVWTTDAEGHVEYVNRQFCDYTGLMQEEMAGSGWLSILHPDDLEMTRQIWMSAVSSGQFYKIEYRFRRVDGVYRWFLGQGIPQKDEHGRIYRWFGTCTDIEPQKQLEQTRLLLLEQEKAARKQAENANRAKDEFLAVLSHELRSPLSPILGWTQLLQSGNLDKTRQREALATIERNARLQTQLIDDLLDIARIMQGKLSLTAAPVSLTSVITAAIETVRLAAEAKNIQILLDLATEIAPVSGDAARLQQVVWNLLTNAVKFTTGGGQVTVELRRVDGSAQIRVVDTGKGISPDFLPHVFEYFRQADSTTTRKFGGLGLGLAIVRQIVETHGGTVWAESAGEDRGATFTVQLPLSLQASAEAPELPHDSVTTEAPLKNLQILLVDDDTDTREFESFVLEQSGANVKAVASGFEALQVLDRFVPDVLVSDIGMAEMDGYMLIRQIRARPAEEGGMMRAIALTAYARDSDQQKALEAGFQVHLTKPIEPEVLVRAISDLISR